ncbi:MAG: hypothetical protein ACI8UO_002660 [Verrucomicrobiales bacterium]|jgi:hypothetical protein
MKTRFGLSAFLRFGAVIGALGLFASYVFFQHNRYTDRAGEGPATVSASWVVVPEVLIAGESDSVLDGNGFRLSWIEEDSNGVILEEAVPLRELSHSPSVPTVHVNGQEIVLVDQAILASSSKSGAIFLPDSGGEVMILAGSGKSSALAIQNKGIIRATSSETGGRVILRANNEKPSSPAIMPGSKYVVISGIAPAAVKPIEADQPVVAMAASSKSGIIRGSAGQIILTASSGSIDSAEILPPAAAGDGVVDAAVVLDISSTEPDEK